MKNSIIKRLLIICLLFGFFYLQAESSENVEGEGKFGESINLSCNYDLASIREGECFMVNCDMDLDYKNISLPLNVDIIYERENLFNRTLRFSNDNFFFGRLFNNYLNITGSKPVGQDSSFKLDPERWGIVQGVVSDDVALENKKILQYIIEYISLRGFNTLVIDKMDAYFAVGGNYSLSSDVLENGVSLPSGFNLQMTNNTYLRVQPNKWARYNLLNVYLQNNVTITGGNLIGDRYTHDYSPITDEFGISRNSHEWPTLLAIAGSHNVVVDGVNIKNSTGDGLVFASGTNRLYTPAIYCQNVLVKNCTIDRSRRDNVTFGDGEYLTLENCTITNAGGGGVPIYDSTGTRIYDSSGVAPQLGVDLEAHRELDPVTGQYIDFQKVEHVIIRGNKFIGNYTADIVVYTANDVLIENNTCDNSIGGTLFYNTTIQNNTLIQNPNGVKTSIGILCNPLSDVTRVYNNNIIGNKIDGFDTGISAFGQNITIKDNLVRDFKEAIYLRKVFDSEISNNDYQSDRTISYGYLSFGGSTSNVVIKNDRINVKHRPLYLYSFNKKSAEDKLIVESCEFTSPKELYLELTNNVTIKNNKLIISKQIKEVNCVNIVLQNNI